ncbi:MAG: hypothetical protein Q9175_002460 [Cornicularia normoerica]
MLGMFSFRKGTLGLHAAPGSSPEAARESFFWNLWKNKGRKLAALVVGPATLIFPSAMLLYWISSSAAAVIVHHICGSLLKLRFIRVTMAPGKGKPGEAKHKSKPKMEEYRGPTMKDLRSQKKKK